MLMLAERAGGAKFSGHMRCGLNIEGPPPDGQGAVRPFFKTILSRLVVPGAPCFRILAWGAARAALSGAPRCLGLLLVPACLTDRLWMQSLQLLE